MADEFGGGLLRYGVNQFVLCLGEKHLRGFVGGVVVGREFEQFSHFLIKPHFAGADVADSFQQFVKIIHASVGIFQAFVVQHESFFQIARQNLVGPTAKLHAAFAAHAEADGQNHF